MHTLNRTGTWKAGSGMRGPLGLASLVARICVLVALCGCISSGQEPDAATVIRDVDAAVNARYENVLGFTALEHYAVFRGKDQVHPSAEVTVRDTYTKGVGKSFAVVSQSGSMIILKIGLQPLLDNERVINQPGNLPQSWFTSANYLMQLAGAEQLDGRDCLRLSVQARRKAPNAINGSIWVDAKDGTLVKIDGVATKSPSAFTGPPHLMRQYVNIEGYSMAAHARAESNSSLFGATVVLIDYSDYHLEVAPAKLSASQR